MHCINIHQVVWLRRWLDQPCYATLCVDGFQDILWLKNTVYFMWKDYGDDEV